MTNRRFSSAPVTLVVAGATPPAPCLPANRPPRRLDAGAVNAALTRGTTGRRRVTRTPLTENPQPDRDRPSAEAQSPGPLPEFLLVELHRVYEAGVLRAALRTVAPEAGADALWERTVDGPDGLDRLLAELGRSLTTGSRMRALLVDDRRGGPRRLFLGIAAGPSARAVRLVAELREALAQPPEPVTVPTSALQREMLRQVIGRSDHAGRHVEQLSWNWHGPLDTERFTAAWQSVFDHETVLRAAFDWDEHEGGDPWLVLHEHAAPEVVRHPHGTVGWDELLEADRLRGFDLRRPALLRATLLDSGPHDDPADDSADGPSEGPHDGEQTGAADDSPATRVLLTYHHAMLDGWSVRLLLQSFYRAYLTGGVLPGGERRPDVRDHARWLDTQDPEAARQFWATRAAATAVLPLTPDPARHGSGRARRRLTPYEAVRLRGWAAAWGAGESSALQAAWALLLYRSALSREQRRPARAVRVGFAVTVSGRGIPLDGIGRLPGALRNPLPITVRVHPSTTVPQLLAALRDGVLDLASYEWVSPGQAHRWNATPRGQRPHSLIVLEHQPSAPHHLRLETDLAAHGIHVESPVPNGTFTSYPITLAAHYDATGGLVLTTTHDRALLADRDAAELLSQSAHLLRSFPDLPSGLTTTEVLRTTLAGQPAPGTPVSGGAAGDPADAPAVRLDVLRRATRPGAGWVLLLPPPGAPHTRYPTAADAWPGPQALAVLRPVLGDPPPVAYRPLLTPLLESRTPVALVAPPGTGLTAFEIARLGSPAPPPLVVLLPDTPDLSTPDLSTLGHLLAPHLDRP
ncbi:condensation domain-containing protein [Kitasatospora sp. NPDC097643]|uniref:condensation domain-containing protein n=1 Tax=Kitasatospora sp. NPDC097643 TaxID=3157230 RepID=UPI00332D7C64